MRPNPHETARKIAEEALSRLFAEMQSGRSEALTTYLAAMSRLRGHSWSNVLLIAAQRPEATRVAGIHAWNDIGRRVKKGEKGILIMAPAGSMQTPARSAIPLRDDPLRLAGVRAAYVFDVAQTEGKPVIEAARTTIDPKRYGEIADLAREYLEQRPAATLSPELRQAQAEAAAHVVSRRLGLETKSPACEPSLLHHGGNQGALAQSLAVIHEISAQILEDLLPEGRTSGRRVMAELPRDDAFLVDAEGFGRFHSKYRDRLVQSIASLVRDRDRAEDIAAQAFGKAWEKRQDFRGEASSRTWLQAIARNEARDSWRRERVGQFDSVDRADAPELAAPEQVADELERREELARLKTALGRIPERYRQVLTDHFISGLQVREIARRERVPLGTALSRIHTAKQLLREAWQASLGAPHSEGTGRGEPSSQPTPRHESQASGAGTERGTGASPEPLAWDR